MGNIVGLVAQLSELAYNIILSKLEIIKKDPGDYLATVALKLVKKDVDDLIEGICAIAVHRNIFYLWRLVASDPDDDFLNVGWCEGAGEP